MSMHVVICRRGPDGIYRLAVRLPVPSFVSLDSLNETILHQSDVFSAVMKRKISLAEGLFDCKCQYEMFNPEQETYFTNHSFFKTAPAMNSLHTNMNPNGEAVRACLLELARYVMTLEKKHEQEKLHPSTPEQVC